MNILTKDLQTLLERRPALWPELADASLFITGGTGWFGHWLLETIAHVNQTLDLDIRATVLTRNPEKFAQQAPHLVHAGFLTLHQGDIRNFVFPKGQFTHIAHMAATSARETFMGANAQEKFNTLVDGTRHLLEFAAGSGAKHLLITSSGVVYGAQNHAPCREESDSAPDTCDPQTALGQGKRAAEFLCAAYAAQHGINLSIARCFSFVGPFMPMNLHYAIGDFIAQASRGEPIVIKGDGKPVRSYLYAADLAIWLFTLLTRQGAPRIYNVGSSSGLTLSDLATTVRDTINPGGEIRVLGNPDYSVGNPVRNGYVPDIRRAREELALETWTPLETAIQRTFRWFSS
ncbi:dTDP-glucose 4,6-dehydratase [Betaproteobacteria bacterium]|nr:dTDP-glucose 4,6-dehydratase [Betaproteobacteria bacterium]GHU46418.1 dTDP-glucose 4,6-dehydratase [Betaproteobacteria bacterium]